MILFSSVCYIYVTKNHDEKWKSTVVLTKSDRDAQSESVGVGCRVEKAAREKGKTIPVEGR